MARSRLGAMRLATAIAFGKMQAAMMMPASSQQHAAMPIATRYSSTVSIVTNRRIGNQIQVEMGSSRLARGRMGQRHHLVGVVDGMLGLCGVAKHCERLLDELLQVRLARVDDVADPRCTAE